MKLINKEIEKLFNKYPIGSQEEKLGNAKVIVKFFNPVGAGTWLITEGSKMGNDDYEMFGYCHLGDDEMAEFGYIHLSELESVSLPLGLGIERDLYYPKDITMIDAIKRERFEVPEFLLEENESEIETEL